MEALNLNNASISSTLPNANLHLPPLPPTPDPMQPPLNLTRAVGKKPSRENETSESEKRKKVASSSEDEMSCSNHEESSSSQKDNVEYNVEKPREKQMFAKEVGDGKPDFSWSECCGKLKFLLDLFLPLRELASKISNDTIVDHYLMNIKIDDLTTTLKEACDELLVSCQGYFFASDLESQHSKIDDESANGNLVAHDPGIRQIIENEAQRKFLIGLGPILSSFPVHNEENKFICRWSKKFPLLEYSTIKDAAFCFICSLFPKGIGREKAESAWTSKGISSEETAARQGSAFRGNETDDENFSQIVRLMSRHDYMLKKCLDNRKLRPYHTTYMSSKSQNGFFELLGDGVRKSIVNEIQTAPFITVMADHTPDIPHEDMISVVIRFVDDQGCPRERLISTGHGTASDILRILNLKNIDLFNLSLQSYDFASAMSGKFIGS
ncbi:unnamed protein product [Phaedon cochleariae]|uniref:DUF4371 domain-containing protein n=1 Tax=Phaedon cochleariae TaxID=80249 RepID=A0A9N9S8T4_PHACE|nr:unnamed protein product [Phaedon cochleariae]